MNIKSVLKQVNRRHFTNNTQRVAYKLLDANGDWVSRKQLERVATSAPARVRDLRKPEFGEFDVECESAFVLDKKAAPNTFFYRIRPSKVKKTQVNTVFRI